VSSFNLRDQVRVRVRKIVDPRVQSEVVQAGSGKLRVRFMAFRPFFGPFFAKYSEAGVNLDVKLGRRRQVGSQAALKFEVDR
jgi:hypothetical protein